MIKNEKFELNFELQLDIKRWCENKKKIIEKIILLMVIHKIINNQLKI